MRGVGGNGSKKGYHAAEINRCGTYLITDGGSQAWAIVTQRGVILVDVPEPLQVVPAIAEITDKPITALTFDFDVLIAGHNTRLGNRNDVPVQTQYMQDIMTFTEEIMNDPNMLSTAVNAIDAVHGKKFAFQPVAKWA